MTTRVAPLAAISIDCPDPRALAPFYCQLLGLEEALSTPDDSLIALSGAGPYLVLMRVENYQPPQWPDGPQTQQMHLDLKAEDLDRDVAAALELGATEASVQPQPDRWRVLLDPVGHPFCLSVVSAL